MAAAPAPVKRESLYMKSSGVLGSMYKAYDGAGKILETSDWSLYIAYTRISWRALQNSLARASSYPVVWVRE